MSLLDALSPYKLLVEVAVVGSIVIGIGVAIHGFLEHEQGIGAAKVQALWDQQKAIDSAAAEKTEKEWREKYDQAVSKGSENAQTLQREAAATRIAADSLRSTNATLQQLLSSANAETARKYAATYANVFNDCVARYQTMGAAAQGHANDAAILSAAWPQSQVAPAK